MDKPAAPKPVPYLLILLVVLGGGIAFLSQPHTGSTANASPPPGMTNPGTHSDAVPHAPNMQSFGSYHVEATVSPKGSVELHFYGGKTSELMPISTMTADVAEADVIVPGEDPIPLSLEAKPYANEPSGESSRFVGHFARRADQTQVGLSLALPYQSTNYRINWTPDTLVFGAVGHGDTAMPAAVTDDVARKLFLTPGGIYTQADIAANGNTTAAIKYAGMMAHHSMNPAKGDAICPVTNTVADPRFGWVIGGKKYLFCCPPCVEEFVKKAKEKPQSVLPPEKYVNN